MKKSKKRVFLSPFLVFVLILIILVIAILITVLATQQPASPQIPR